jgi:hypothetical protein
MGSRFFVADDDRNRSWRASLRPASTPRQHSGPIANFPQPLNLAGQPVESANLLQVARSGSAAKSKKTFRSARQESDK